jgi:Fur family transcriptional regulator, stress-responsive regulator
MNQELLRRHGMQVTPQRLAVLQAVAERPHSTTDDVDAVVRAEIGSVSRQAVYDALAALTEKGIIRRIQPAGSPARYETRVVDNHHHLICRSCGQVVDVDCAVGYAPCLTAADDAGYEIDEAEVFFWGRCPVCAAPTSDPSTGRGPHGAAATIAQPTPGSNQRPERPAVTETAKEEDRHV